MAQEKRTAPTKALRDSVEQVWLAGLGALALTEEEGSRLFRSLVRKGERVERRTRGRVTEALDGAKEALDSAKEAPRVTMTRLSARTDDVLESVLRRLGVPTRGEIASLTRRIEGITSTVEARTVPARRTTRPRKAAVKH